MVKCRICGKDKNKNEYYANWLNRKTPYDVCKECHSKRNKENKIKRKAFEKVILDGLFADFINNIPSETVIKNQAKKHLEQKQNKIKNHKNWYSKRELYLSIKLPKDLSNEVKNYLDTHNEYLSLKDFVRETIRGKILGDKMKREKSH